MSRQFTLLKAEAFDALNRRIADSRAALLASTEAFVAGEILTTLAEGFSYEVVASGGHLVTAGGVSLRVLPQGAGAGGMYPAAAFGSDATAASAAFAAAIADPAASGVVFRGDWQIDETVTVSDPHNLRVDARSAFFQTGSDILMFDVNGRADATYSDNESRQNFHWEGGRFGCTVANPTQATAMRVMGLRHATLAIEDIGLTGGGFARGIVLGGKDSIYISGTKFYDTGRCIEVAPWSAIGGPLNFVLEKLHGSIGNGGQLVRSYLPLSDCTIRDCSCNMGTGASQRAIEVSRYVCVGIPGVAPAFQPGESVLGATSGATANFVEAYTHFPFGLGGHTTWLVLENRAGSFVAGEALTGQSSGATATIPPEAGYLVQDREWSDFSIGGLMHFEAGSGANGATAVSLRDREGTGKGPVCFDLNLGTCGLNGGGAVGLELERISNVRVSGRFTQTLGNGFPMRFDPKCADITVMPGTRLSTGTIDLGGMDRDALDLGAFDVLFGRANTVSGWNSRSLSTQAPTVLDMAQDFPAFATVGGLAPRAWLFNVNIRDTASESAASSPRPRFRMWHPDDVTAAQFCDLTASGVPDNEWRGAQMTVGADSSGAVEYDCLATGTGTLEVNLRVVRMMF